eukprot:6190308-Pleurochrysis_carterae.AAC.2
MRQGLAASSCCGLKEQTLVYSDLSSTVFSLSAQQSVNRDRMVVRRSAKSLHVLSADCWQTLLVRAGRCCEPELRVPAAEADGRRATADLAEEARSALEIARLERDGMLAQAGSFAIPEGSAYRLTRAPAVRAHAAGKRHSRSHFTPPAVAAPTTCKLHTLWRFSERSREALSRIERQAEMDPHFSEGFSHSEY